MLHRHPGVVLRAVCRAFAAVEGSGSVITWGSEVNGGDSSMVAEQLASGITRVFSTGSAFAALKASEAPAIAAPTRKGLAWFWGGLAVSAVISGVSYVWLSQQTWLYGTFFNSAPSIFPQGAVFFIALWAAINGVLGAIIANTSGTGGGVVFVPVFNALREHGIMALDPLHVVAASMGIQSFGMTMGALRWTDRLYHQPEPAPLHARVAPRDFFAVALAVLALSLPAMLLTQRLTAFDQHAVLMGYKAFSILLGLALIASTWTVNLTRPERGTLQRGDRLGITLQLETGETYSGEGHSEEWRFEFSRSYPH